MSLGIDEVDYTVTHVNSSPRRRPQMSPASQLLMVDGKSVKLAMPSSDPTISITLCYVNFLSQHLSLMFSPSVIGGHALPSVFKTSRLRLSLMNLFLARLAIAASVLFLSFFETSHKTVTRSVKSDDP